MSNSNKDNKDRKGKKKSIYLDKEALEKLDETAKKEDRSISYVINAILRKHYNLDSKDEPEEKG